MFKKLFLLTVFLCLAVLPVYADPPHEMPAVTGGELSSTINATTLSLDGFNIIWNPENAQLAIIHETQPEKTVWNNVSGQPFLAAGTGTETVEEARGYFFFDETREKICANQTINAINQENDAILIQGQLLDGETPCTDYRMTLSLSEDTSQALKMQVTLDNPDYNRLYLTTAATPDERFFGFGVQFSFFDAKGLRLPIWVSEQGIGRGAQPITRGADLTAQAGGDYYTTYAPIPHYISSEMRSMFIDESVYMLFDMTLPDRIQAEVWNNELTTLIYSGETPADLIEAHTSVVGRMQPLPDWLTEGAIIGMQGGTTQVQTVYEQLQEYNVPISAFWLQDWVGRRTTSFGEQLWWNWELDEERYPDWNALVDAFREDDIFVLSYVSPFLTDVSEKPGVERNLYAEAVENGYLVTTPEGDPYDTLITDFSAALVDLTNEEAYAWYRDVLLEQALQTGVQGWMADFGEGLPYDAVLADGTGQTLHNHYPELWAQFNQDIVAELDMTGDFVFFMRSGYARSPGYSTLFWLGDQLVDWHAQDGIKTAVTGLLTSGLSGYAYNHSDIGGYTGVAALSITRSEELLLRWMDLNAMTTIFRTHEGNLPVENVQFYDNETTLAHFARMAQVYTAWDFYRQQLINEASEMGMPVIRHPFLHYPDDLQVYDISYEQFMVGDQFMVAPVLDPETNEVSVYLPAGEWIHLWSGESYIGEQTVTVSAPVGKPGIFYVAGSPVGEQFAENLRVQGLIE